MLSYIHEVGRHEIEGVNQMGRNKVQKTCFILVRYFVKSSKSICCIIRNEQGTDYTTCLHANGRTSCTCDAGERGQACYHATHLLNTEHARPVVTPVALSPITPEQAETLIQDGELGLLALIQLPSATETVTKNLTTGRPATIGKPLPKAPVVSTDIGTRGSLSRAFSFMK